MRRKEDWNHGSLTTPTLARRIGNANSIGKLTFLLGGSAAVSPLAFGGDITFDFPSDAPVHSSSFPTLVFSIFFLLYFSLEMNHHSLEMNILCSLLFSGGGSSKTLSAV